MSIWGILAHEFVFVNLIQKLQIKQLTEETKYKSVSVNLKQKLKRGELVILILCLA